MSRFFRGDESSSSSEEESSEEESSEEEIQQPKSQFARGGDSSESEDEGPRVVKSHRDRMFDELVVLVRGTRAHMTGNLWSDIQTDFDKILKLLQKMNQIIAKEGLPKFYIKLVGDLEDQLTTLAANKEEVRKMKSAHAKALNAMKQKLRKYTKEEGIHIFLRCHLRYSLGIRTLQVWMRKFWITNSTLRRMRTFRHRLPLLPKARAKMRLPNLQPSPKRRLRLQNLLQCRQSSPRNRPRTMKILKTGTMTMMTTNPRPPLRTMMPPKLEFQSG